MTRTWLLVLGALATVAFAALVLVGLPRVVLTDVPVPRQLLPAPGPQGEARARSIARGREVYIENGCVYCHSQQVRDPSFTSDLQRGWGNRATVPADYVLDSPHLLGTMRTGPDLINVGQRLPDPEWHLIHLYDPRALVEWSIMPAFPYLFEERSADDVGQQERVVPVTGPRAPAGRVVVARPDALALVDYLLSLQRTYPLPDAEAPEAAGRDPETMP
ncbi:MAG: cbb3-type cytochrome c oxidase subunit II [Gemmatimonadota bacterium]